MKKDNYTSNRLAFKEIKKRITECDLDPDEKGYLLKRINQVIRNKKSWFEDGNLEKGVANLFNWLSNEDRNISDTLDFWSDFSTYILNNSEYSKNMMKKHIAEALS